MITHIRLQNFKCFDDETLQLRSLTLVAGANAGGKSSLLQALLLFRQALSAQVGYVRLNGPYGLALGRSDDVVQHSEEAQNDITIEITTHDAAKHTLRLRAHGEELVLHIMAPVSSGLPELTYLSAERMGPRDTLESDSVPSELLEVGYRGEFTAQVLARLGAGRGARGKVIEPLLHPANTHVSMFHKQVEFWMQDIAPGIEINALIVTDTNASALSLRRGGVRWLRPPNIGFGISYSLPIIVAGLLARPGSIFVVENPEAHLHPAGQSRMGRFLATLAAAGIQVLVETHSDHVLNGVLLATVDDHPIRHDQVIIQYFHGDPKSEKRAQAIDVNARGGLSTWPKGFFDQSEKDMAAILKARKNG